jgi:hypothetical protein
MCRRIAIKARGRARGLRRFVIALSRRIPQRRSGMCRRIAIFGP